MWDGLDATVGETPGSKNTKGVRNDPQIPDLRKQVMFSLGEARTIAGGADGGGEMVNSFVCSDTGMALG